MANFIKVRTIDKEEVTINTDLIGYVVKDGDGKAAIFIQGPFNAGMGKFFAIEMPYDEFIAKLI